MKRPEIKYLFYFYTELTTMNLHSLRNISKIGIECEKPPKTHRAKTCSHSWPNGTYCDRM